jgi:general secretion pathway protein D
MSWAEAEKLIFLIIRCSSTPSMIRISPQIDFSTSRLLCAFLLASASMVEYGSVLAGPPSTVGIAEKEVQRRAAMIETQAARLSEAGALYEAGNFQAAYALYQEIYQSVPDVPLAQEVRAVAREGCLHSGLKRASELMAVGSYPEARQILDALDSPGVAKGRREIADLRARLDDPDRYPPALTPKHVEDVSEVQRLLLMAASQQETGMYDKALSTYEDVLRIDTTNSAARRGMERVEMDRARYFEAAKDHQRSRMLNGVNELWEDKPRLKAAEISALFSAERAQQAGAGQKSGRISIAAKLRDLRIERVDFSAANLEEVLEYLRVRARDLDPAKKGVDFVNGVSGDTNLRPISLNLTNVPIEEVLRYVSEIAGVNYRIEEYAVRIIPLTDTNQTIIAKSYRVPPDFITSAPTAAPTGAAPDPFTAQAPGVAAAGTLVRRLGAKEYLESRGVNFPEGAGASYNPVANMLTVRNTAKNIELIDGLVEQTLNSSPKMAVIEVKILEVDQSKLEEFGFDWLLDSFGSQMTFAGGTVGNAQNSNFRINEFPENSALSSGIGPVTAGLRSSGDLTARGVDDVLYGTSSPTSRRSPGALSLTGLLTTPQFQVVWRALDQKTGIDLISKPSVITKSGVKATIEIVREFIYPTEYDPPQIPTNVGSSTTTLTVGGVVVSSVTERPAVPVTPTTPTAFETRRVGMILDVEPQISEDGKTVDMLINPDFTEFLGFVNYGSPIYQVSGNSRDELTPNIITQPIFSTKKIVTGVKVYDGQTVVLGGLMSEQSIIIKDQIPVVGDLPFVGRFFQSKVKQKRAKNLLFFVTVKVVDPSGNRINPDM